MVFNKPVNVKQRSQLTLANVSVALQRRHDYVQQDDSVAGGTDYFIEALLPAEFEFKWIMDESPSATDWLWSTSKLAVATFLSQRYLSITRDVISLYLLVSVRLYR